MHALSIRLRAVEHLLDRKKSGDRRVILAQYSYPISAYPDAYHSVVLRVRMTICRSKRSLLVREILYRIDILMS